MGDALDTLVLWPGGFPQPTQFGNACFDGLILSVQVQFGDLTPRYVALSPSGTPTTVHLLKRPQYWTVLLENGSLASAYWSQVRPI